MQGEGHTNMYLGQYSLFIYLFVCLFILIQYKVVVFIMSATVFPRNFYINKQSCHF